METTQATNTETRKEKSCSELVNKNYRERLEEFKNAQDFFKLCPELMDAEELKAYNIEKEEYEHYEDFFDYVNQSGLCFDRVEAGTFEDQRAGYWRWQLSWGGPADEFRLFDNNDLEYWYLDWGDGACVNVKDEIFENIMANFKELSAEDC
tara:strand:- start:235 stop:687 length:453 start_codon:yes stop_codon:yes gene_type:complete